MVTICLYLVFNNSVCYNQMALYCVSIIRYQSHMIVVLYIIVKGVKRMNELIKKINEKQIKPDTPEFRVGDTVRVDVWIREGKKERIQAFEGLVVAKSGGSVSETFTVRKKSGSVAVKRTFPVNSPLVDKITVVKRGLVRRAKLNFIDKMNKEYKVKERSIQNKKNDSKPAKKAAKEQKTEENNTDKGE